MITPSEGPEFVETLPVRKFHGVGPATERKIKELDVVTRRDLKAQSLEFLQQHFGKAGAYYYWAARGIDERPVRATDPQIGRRQKHLSNRPVHLNAARAALQDIIEKVWEHCDGPEPRPHRHA